MEVERDSGLPSTSSLLKWLQLPGQCQEPPASSRGSLPTGGRDPKHVSYYFQSINRGLVLKWRNQSMNWWCPYGTPLLQQLFPLCYSAGS